MSQPTIALVGGFLGAGKTTLILAAATALKARGLRVAAIMNDQDTGLVDTHMVSANEINTREVAGGCFCCRFSDLLAAAQELCAYQPDVIFAEPVGSCIDLSASILQPLKAFHRGSYNIAPLTVLFDPNLATRVFANLVDPDSEYLFRNQLLEADILCATKSDLYPAPPLPVPVDFSLSSKTGEGLGPWLNEVLSGNRVAGSQLLQVDYSRYAEAEAALGWLNLHADIELVAASSPSVFVGPLLETLESKLTESAIEIAHLKIFDRSDSGFVKASICANGDNAQADGDLIADPAIHHELAINLRAIASPDRLSAIVTDVLSKVQGKVRVRHRSSFRPAAPNPEHRFSKVF